MYYSEVKGVRIKDKYKYISKIMDTENKNRIKIVGNSKRDRERNRIYRKE